jgi:tetratricopeptide (TPR) repeat protein
LKYESNDIELWISLAIAVVAVPIVDYEKSIACLEKALSIDTNNPIVLMVLAHVYEYELGGIDDMLLHQIKILHTDSDEINSMLKYVVLWSYREHKKSDPEAEEKLLKESIDLCDKHVWNYEHLARLYNKQKRYLEINKLIKKALNNVKKIYTDENIHEYQTTSVDDFINSRIKGTHITDNNVDMIQKELIPTHAVCFYTVVTPFLLFMNLLRLKFFNQCI